MNRNNSPDDDTNPDGRRPGAEAYDPPPGAGNSTVGHAQLKITHDFQVARLNRRVKLLQRIVRKTFLTNTPSASPNAADNIGAPPPERNTEIPRLAAQAARSCEAMEIDINSMSAASLPFASTPLEHAGMCSNYVWDFPTLREFQREVLVDVFDPATAMMKLIVQPTSRGKSHVMRVMGTMFRGVHLICHPLLALTADQVAAFEQGNQSFGNIEVHNLDEHAARSKPTRRKIMERITSLKRNTTSTIFLFASPQFLALHDDFVKALLQCAKKYTLRSVCLDEAHLFAQHGSSFRAEIRKISNTLFKPLFSVERHPYLMCLTATLSLEDKLVLEDLVHSKFPPDTQLWASANEFEQDHIKIRLKVTSDYSCHLKDIVDHVQSDPGSVYIFANSKSLTFKLLQSLEDKLDDIEERVDVLHIHGGLDKARKFHLVNIFCGNVAVDGISPRITVATAAADLGVSNKLANWIDIYELPENIGVGVQRKGRGSRNGQTSVARINGGLSSYIGLVKRTYRQRHVNDDDNDDDDNVDYNTTVSVSSRRVSSAQQKINDDYPLTDTDRSNLMRRQLKQLREVLDLFAMNKGCIQRRIQQYLADGEMVDARVDLSSPCRSKCPICSGSWNVFFRPVCREGLMSWFEHVEGMPCEATYDNLMDKIWKADHWVKAIFDVAKASMCKYNVEALLLQLIAAELIRIERRGGKLYWVICKESDECAIPKYCYKNYDNWNGIYLHPQNRTRTHTLAEIEK